MAAAKTVERNTHTHTSSLGVTDDLLESMQRYISFVERRQEELGNLCRAMRSETILHTSSADGLLTADKSSTPERPVKEPVYGATPTITSLSSDTIYLPTTLTLPSNPPSPKSRTQSSSPTVPQDLPSGANAQRK
ncbi:hypothetical protein P154DRAFT_526897 [Amniculicola lignicola CBS 123094]|uniref:Uncharacterized protein n=1 Tax=Amniculicola lignicola CBS 123094 TaxID=1392246 RepID=A0A6A5W3A4_9PLEO|nr:hypothetical protein P154DRAFT_526897 [Amniculicola lignicola CBS 123094]